tara:strand:- start:2222 stop:3295 length:1074 start_codon:yes stop_codon:yes gene_type:complete
MKVDNKSFTSIWIDNQKKVWIIDQTKIPFQFNTLELSNIDDFIFAIKFMQVRGAPLIGITAAYGIYIAMQFDTSDQNLMKAAKTLLATRPTAINLKWALDSMLEQLINIPGKDRVKKALKIANKMSEDDIKINEKIGINGLQVIEKLYEKKKDKINILTHCNAGWLATVDWGTATAPIYKSRDNNIPIHIWVDETRPRNQGSFLTSWELMNENIDHTIIADNTGGHLMQNNLVDIVITGSDRTTYQGDVCNKVGTYLKAIAAYENNIPFYVALPSSTIDWSNNLKDIIIEERDENEIHYLEGLDANKKIKKIRITPEYTKAKNYAFDITPSKYITGLITENGVCSAKEQEIKKYNEK